MFPERQHSVSLFWESERSPRFSRYFVNMEEPFRRTAVGFDTQDHTLDAVVRPDLTWNWRDETELENHVREGFFTPELAESIRAEGLRAIDEISRGTHPCLGGWNQWSPRTDDIPEIPREWDTTPATYWSKRHWAYGVAD
jgi:hypothetical protein